jgi:hypothetical protein
MPLNIPFQKRLWIALYKKKRQTNIKLMTNTKTVEQKENEYGQNKMNSFYLNRQSGFVLKYRNCTHLPSWIRLQWLKIILKWQQYKC